MKFKTGMILLGWMLAGSVLADWQQQGQEAMRNGQYPAAIAIYTATLEENPFNAIAANNIAVAYAMQRDYNKAREWLQKAIRMDSRRKDIALNHDTLQRWLKDHNYLASGNQPVPAAVAGPLSPEPPALW